MYDCVYAEILDSKVATPLEESWYYFINRYGSQVNTEEEAAGHQINHHLIHPQHVLFGDEAGTDTNHMEDGNNGGHRYISVKGTRINLMSSKSSGLFTLMGLAAETYEPVLCIGILATKILSVTGFKVFDYCASISYNSSNTMEENMVEVKALPVLPVYKFRG